MDLAAEELLGEVGEAIAVGRDPQSVALDEGDVCVPSRKDGTVTRIDDESSRPIGKPIKIEGLGHSVAAGGGVAWVAGGKDLIRIKP